MAMNDELSDLLLSLQSYGKPSISLTYSGWFCRVELEGFGRGARFDVVSDMNNLTPSDAVIQCLERSAEAWEAMK